LTLFCGIIPITKREREEVEEMHTMLITMLEVLHAHMLLVALVVALLVALTYVAEKIAE
jgi:flagellar biosynthesis protein FliQ